MTNEKTMTSASWFLARD